MFIDLLDCLKENINFLTCFFKFPDSKSVCKEPPPRPDSWMPRHGKAWRKVGKKSTLPSSPNLSIHTGCNRSSSFEPLTGLNHAGAQTRACAAACGSPNSISPYLSGS